jgi:hypothetical protein
LWGVINRVLCFCIGVCVYSCCCRRRRLCVVVDVVVVFVVVDIGLTNMLMLTTLICLALFTFCLQFLVDFPFPVAFSHYANPIVVLYRFFFITFSPLFAPAQSSGIYCRV